MAQVTQYLSLKQKATLFFGLSLQIMAIIFVIQLAVDTSWRMVYPFIPQFSEGLGLTIVGFSWLIFVRSIASLVLAVLLLRRYLHDHSG